MLAQPSGEITEYTAFSSIQTRSATARASAPPLPPSPINMEITGTQRVVISIKFSAMACPWPRSSAPTPQNAPEVSIKQITGRPNFSACFISLSALRYPSGLGAPKLRYTLSLAVCPFSMAITVTGLPHRRAIPPTTAGSSANRLSPCISIKPLKIFLI